MDLGLLSSNVCPTHGVVYAQYISLCEAQQRLELARDAYLEGGIQNVIKSCCAPETLSIAEIHVIAQRRSRHPEGHKIKDREEETNKLAKDSLSCLV